MPTYKVVRVQPASGVNLILVPVIWQFQQMTNREQLIAEIQMHASAAGWEGVVIPVWDGGAAGLGFLAPPTYRTYLSGAAFQWVIANLNGELSWPDP